MNLSIIIPAYNPGSLLARCVGSIRVPEDWTYEVIIVDDGSTDVETLRVCKELECTDNRIRVIHTPNRGAYEARLTGLSNARGEWIMFADSDDSLTPDGITGLAGHISSGADIIIGTLNLNNRSLFKHEIEGLTNPREYIAALLEGRTSIGPCGKLYARRLFSEHLISPRQRIKVNEDLLLLLTAATRAKSVYIDPDLVCYNYIFQENSMRTALMPIPTWKYLFSLIADVIKPWLKYPDIRKAYRRYRLNLIQNAMIKRGQYLTPSDSIAKTLTDENFWEDLTDSEIHALKLLKSPARQRAIHWRTMLVASVKRLAKKFHSWA